MESISLATVNSSFSQGTVIEGHVLMKTKLGQGFVLLRKWRETKSGANLGNNFLTVQDNKILFELITPQAE